MAPVLLLMAAFMLVAPARSVQIGFNGEYGNWGSWGNCNVGAYICGMQIR